MDAAVECIVEDHRPRTLQWSEWRTKRLAVAMRGMDALERDRPERGPLEGAVVVLRPASGEIVALVGGRHGTRGGFHRALDARRQPGSAFKPFVALAAFAKGARLPPFVGPDRPLGPPDPPEPPADEPGDSGPPPVATPRATDRVRTT